MFGSYRPSAGCISWHANHSWQQFCEQFGAAAPTNSQLKEKLRGQRTAQMARVRTVGLTGSSSTAHCRTGRAKEWWFAQTSAVSGAPKAHF
eukprot:1657495-Amphidinium_carterae.1